MRPFPGISSGLLLTLLITTSLIGGVPGTSSAEEPPSAIGDAVGADTSPKPPVATAAVVWKDPDLGLSLTAPPGWVQVPTPPGAAAAFAGPAEAGLSPQFVVVAQAERVTGNQLPADLADRVASALKASGTDVVVAADARFDAGGILGQRTDVTYKSRAGASADNPARSMRARQICALRGGRLYAFLFTDSADTFAKNAALFEQALASIHWLKPAEPEAAPMVFEKEGLSIVPPAGWTTVSARDLRTIPGAIAGFREVRPDGAAGALLGVASTRLLPGEAERGDAAEQFLKGLRDQLPGFRVLSRAAGTVDGVPAQSFIGSIGEGQGTMRGVIIIHNNQLKMFLLVTRSEAPDPAAIAAYNRFIPGVRFVEPGPAAGGAP